MTYSLLYSAPLNIFRLLCETTMDQTAKTEAELRTQFAGNSTLLEWLGFSKSNPGKECIYNMLPT